MIVTLTGANDFERSSQLDELVAEFIAKHTDMAVERFDGEETETDRMIGAIQSLPFLTARKLVVLREPSKQKAFAEAIETTAKNVPESTDVVILEPKLDKRLGYYKTLKKLTDFRDFPEMDSNGLARWASEYAKGQGGSLSLPDARFLIDRVGIQQLTVQHEIDKLLLYDPQITRNTIEAMTDSTPQSTVFELLDAAFAGRVAQAQALYQEQRALRTEPQAIVAMLAWQLHSIVAVKLAGTRSGQEIATQARLNPFVVRKTQALTKRLTLERIRRMVAELLELDTRLKSQPIDADEALQLYLLRLANA